MQHDSKSDHIQELFKQASRGDVAAFGKLFDLLYWDLLTVAHEAKWNSGVETDTERILHDMFLKIACKGYVIPNQAAFKRLVYVAGVRVARDLRGARARISGAATEEQEATMISPAVQRCAVEKVRSYVSGLRNDES